MISDIENIVILYVEDEDDAMEVYSRALKRVCTKLIIASNGEDGLELYKKYSPDIIITDINMPKMNGLDMAKAIKAIDDEANIIFTTAYSESHHFLEAINLQVEAYLIKPVSKNFLLSSIKKTIKNISLKRQIIIEHKRNQEQERQILESNKMAQMGEMIGNIAHQWRQPLSVISTAASAIQMEKEYKILEDERLENYCNLITENTEYLSEIIDVFRDFIKEKKEIKEVILQDRIDNALKIITASLSNGYIEFINNIDYAHPIKLFMVVGELSQVIINVINNAKDILMQKNIEKAWVKIDCIKDDNKAIITIEDNAGGIPQDILPKIFDPYFTTKHQSTGTGLGLHMSRRIIHESLNGDLYVKNTKNGAKFFIEIPLS